MKQWVEGVAVGGLGLLCLAAGGVGGWGWARNHPTPEVVVPARTAVPPPVTLSGGGTAVDPVGTPVGLWAWAGRGKRPAAGVRVEWVISGGTFVGGARTAASVTGATGNADSPEIVVGTRAVEVFAFAQVVPSVPLEFRVAPKGAAS